MTSWNRTIAATLVASSLVACANLAERPAGAPFATPPSTTEDAKAGAAGEGASVELDSAQDLAERSVLTALPLDEMSRIDLLNDGEELAEPEGELDASTAQDDESVLRRSDLPHDVLEELDRLAADRLISKSVIGDADTRAPVSDTTLPPYRAIVKIYTQYAAGGGLYGCSGSLIAPDAVLTAAHCVFNSRRSARGYAYSVKVVPAMYPKSPVPASGARYEAPYGTAIGAKVFVPSAYVSKERDGWSKVPYDYAVVRLKTSLGAAGTRRLGIFASPLDHAVTITGYHSDLEKGMRQYTSRDRVRKVFATGVLNHYVDTEKGASGSGLTGTGAWADKIFAVHSSGFESHNAAAAITESNYRVITAWAVRAL